jgi:uncharacterized caspase-like protein
MNANTGKLQYTGNDRQKMVNAFSQRYGKQLQVYEINDVTLAQFQQTILHIKTKLQPKDEVVIYFSGHGSITLDKNNDEADPWDELLVFANEQPLLDDDFTHYLRPFFTHHLTLILDSCNSGDMTKAVRDKHLISKFMPTRTPSKAGFLQKQSMLSMLEHPPFKGILIAAAAATQNAFEDQQQQGGVFTHYFSHAFADKNNSLQKSFSLAKDAVANETNNLQIPVIKMH